MKRSLLIIFLVIIVIPVAAMTWLGFVGYQREKANVSERSRILARRKLEEIDRQVQSFWNDLETELLEYSRVHTYSVDELRLVSRNARLVTQIFLLDPDGTFLFPPEAGETSLREQTFLAQAAELELASILRAKSEASERSDGSGWYTWFMGDGINFVFWHQPNDEVQIGMLLDRISLVSRILAILPDTEIAGSTGETDRIVLNDARGIALYQWGAYRPEGGASPLTTLPLSGPGSAWRLDLYADLSGDSPSTTNTYVILLFGIGTVVLLLIFLAYYFYRENSSLVKDALQKVSFVNQVSHELRTPLTNIRLYADLLEAGDIGEKERRHLAVIESESKRLSRMISNVLTFSQLGRGGFEAHFEEAIVDEILMNVVDAFGPTLE